MDKQHVVVIGGGLGGLSAAISLAQSGYNVSLFEKNSHFGGKLNTLSQDGFNFDLGPSILTMPHIFEALFTRSGRRMPDYLTIQRLDLEWRSFFPDGSMIDLYGDLDRMAEANPTLSAEDMADYRRFLDYAGQLYDLTEAGYLSDQGLDTMGDVLRRHGVVGALQGFDYFSGMFDAIAKYVRHPHLRDMLAYFIKYVGSSPYDAPAVLNMMIAMQQRQGVWYVPGGMSGIAAALVRLADELGVSLNAGQEVVELVRGKRQSIRAARLSDGREISAELFVSNMEVIPASRQLLHEPERRIRRLDRFEPACSGLVLHLGVDRLYPQLAHHNFFFSADPRQHFETVFRKHQLPEDPTLYVVNVSKTDPAQALPGHENIKILPHIPYLQNQPFSRDDYLQLRNRVLVKMERMGITDLRQHIVTEDMWTPEDIRQNYYSDRGAIYGVVSDRIANHGFKHPKRSRWYRNLYFVGGTVNPGGGMPMVTRSGQQTANLIAADWPVRNGPVV